MLFIDNIDKYKPVEWISREISSLHTVIQYQVQFYFCLIL